MFRIMYILWALVLIVTSAMSQPKGHEIVSLNFTDLLLSPKSIKTPLLHLPPVSLYPSYIIRLQSALNANHVEAIVCDPSPHLTTWTEIDSYPITPYTWKWVDLQGTQMDGTNSKISLRRPLWWLEQNNIDRVGSTVTIEIPEMGLYLQATVMNIRPNQLDTRLWNASSSQKEYSMPITGKFCHTSDDVYALYFDREREPLKVTGEHRIWSSDQNNWISSKHLSPGEKVKTLTGEVTVRKIKKMPGTFEVYNLEIYRNHNYYVTKNTALVHNECWNHRWQKILDEVGTKLYSVHNQYSAHIERIRIIYQPSQNWRGNYDKDWIDLYNQFGKNDYPTVIQINVDVTGLSQAEIEQMGDLAQRCGYVAYTHPSVDLQKAKVNGQERVFMPMRRYGNDALPGHGDGAPIVPMPETAWKPGKR